MTTPQLGQQSVQRSMAESGQAMMMQRMQQQQQQSNMSPMGHQQMQQGIANQQQQVLATVRCSRGRLYDGLSGRLSDVRVDEDRGRRRSSAIECSLESSMILFQNAA